MTDLENLFKGLKFAFSKYDERKTFIRMFEGVRNPSYKEFDKFMDRMIKENNNVERHSNFWDKVDEQKYKGCPHSDRLWAFKGMDDEELLKFLEDLSKDIEDDSKRNRILAAYIPEYLKVMVVHRCKKKIEMLSS
jgi:hypothetical protein